MIKTNISTLNITIPEAKDIYNIFKTYHSDIFC